MKRTRSIAIEVKLLRPAYTMIFWLLACQFLLLSTIGCNAVKPQEIRNNNSTRFTELYSEEARGVSGMNLNEKPLLTSSQESEINDNDLIIKDNSNLGHADSNSSSQEEDAINKLRNHNKHQSVFSSKFGDTKNKFPVSEQLEYNRKFHDTEHDNVNKAASSQQRLFRTPNNGTKTPLSSTLVFTASKTSKQFLQRHLEGNKTSDKKDKAVLLPKINNGGNETLRSIGNTSYIVHKAIEIMKTKETHTRNKKAQERALLPSANKEAAIKGKHSLHLVQEETKIKQKVHKRNKETQATPVFSTTSRSEIVQKRPVRSANRITEFRSHSGILPNNCTLAASCSDRQKENVVDNIVWYPCRCEDDCNSFGDCCHDHKQAGQGQSANDHSRKRLPTVTPESLACKLLMPSIHRPHLLPKPVYMVSTCPSSTRKSLHDKCTKTFSASGLQQYLMDIPVVSATSSIVYANIFCAQCHREFKFQKYNVDVTCTDELTSLKQLTNMTYHPGELKWSSKRQNINNNGAQQESEEMHCLLDIQFDDLVGRTCKQNLISTCSDSWQDSDIREKCQFYNYYVEVGSKIYRNWDCALCNNEKQSQIKCLDLYGNYRRGGVLSAPPPSLSDIFKGEKDCAENQIWNYLHNRCEDVSCGYLFTLTDGECIRNNNTNIKDGQSYLNNTCYTHEFQREYSVIYPNNSVYLNHTGKVYHNGEYEFVNHSWIRVCRPEDRWTPTMNIISTVLISFSLIFMALHMIIFFLLPKRRNIPSMNLFCMTLSLFISEMVFVIFFYANQNYGLCVLSGVIIYYFFSASFMWMNVMSIDICRTFHSQTYKIKSKKIFIQYSIYAWSIPMIGTFIALLIDQIASSDFVLTPAFGIDRCWFNNKWGLAAFFTVPSGLIFLFNLFLFGVSVYDIYKQHKSGEFASSTVRKKKTESFAGRKSKDEKEKEKFLKPPSHQKSNEKQESGTVAEMDSPRCAERIRDRIQKRIQAHKKQRMRLVLYSKLALIMGMTWIFAFIRMHVESIVFEYLFIIFNGLQGTFIFLAFDCKQKQWDEIWLKLTGKRLFRIGTKSSSNTGDTALTSSSSNGRYTYRWSSKMNQDRGTKSSTVSKNEQSF